MSLRRALLVILALVAAGATAQLARLWLEGQRRAVAAAVPDRPVKPQVAVLVATDTIPVGSFVSPRSLDWQVWPDVDLPDSFFLRGEVEIESFAGAVARRDLLPGEPVTEAALVRPGERGFLAAVLEPGMRAVSVPIDEATGNAGLVMPGDRVDVLLAHRLDRRSGAGGSASERIVRAARVLAVGQRLSPAGVDDDLPSAKVRTVTLEVTPEDAKRVALAQELGKLVLSLRSLAHDGDAVGEVADAARDEPLWDSELSRAIGARRGVMVLRGGADAGAVTVAAPAETTEEGQ